MQVSLPWTAPHFITDGGPSYIYGAVTTWDLLTNPSSRYGRFYHLQTSPIPNWTGPFLLKGVISLVGVAHADQLMMTFLVCSCFFAFAFACRAFGAGSSAWSPVGAALIQTYFFTRGYYTFQLGMVLCVIVVGCGAIQLARPKLSRAIVLSVLSVALYFTHPLPFLVAVVILAIVACWTELAVLPRGRFTFSGFARIMPSLSPGLLLAFWYAVWSSQNGFQSSPWFDWQRFPVWLMSVSSGAAGHQQYLFACLVLLFVVSIGTMNITDWRGLRGGLAVAALLIALLAALVPDTAFGGEEVRARLLWAALIFGGIVSASASVQRIPGIVLIALIAILTVAGLIRVGQVNRHANAFAGSYLSVLDRFPSGSTIVRLNYPTPASSQQFGIPADLLFLPLLHVDSYAAAMRGSVVLSDYQAVTRTFPVVFRDAFSPRQQQLLQRLDAPQFVAPEDFRELVLSLPVPVDYFVVLGDFSSNTGPGMDPVQAVSIIEASGKKEVFRGNIPSFVRVFH